MRGNERGEPSGSRIVWLSITPGDNFLASWLPRLDGGPQPTESCSPEQRALVESTRLRDRLSQADGTCLARHGHARYVTWNLHTSPARLAPQSPSLSEETEPRRGPGASQGLRTREGRAQSCPKGPDFKAQPFPPRRALKAEIK